MFSAKEYIGVAEGIVPMHAYDEFFRECKFWKDQDNNGVKKKNGVKNLIRVMLINSLASSFPHLVSIAIASRLMQALRI